MSFISGASIEEDLKRRVILKWAIALRTDNQLIGSLTLFNLDFNHRRAEIGYALARDQWGKGYMNEALMALLLRRAVSDVNAEIALRSEPGRRYPNAAALADDLHPARAGDDHVGVLGQPREPRVAAEGIAIEDHERAHLRLLGHVARQNNFCADALRQLEACEVAWRSDGGIESTTACTAERSASPE